MRFFVDPKFPFQLLQLDGVNSMIASSPWLVSVLHRTRLAKRHYYILKEKSQPLQTPLQNWNGSKMGINSNMHVMWLSTWVYAKQKPCAFWGRWNAVLWNPNLVQRSFVSKTNVLSGEDVIFFVSACVLHLIELLSRVAQKYTRHSQEYPAFWFCTCSWKKSWTIRNWLDWSFFGH